jgi:hypothetical protein
LPNQLAYATDFPTTRAHELFNGLFAFFEKDNSEDMSGVLKMLGVAYVLQQNDISWKFASPGTLSPAEMMNVLRARPELVLKQRFGKLDLYEVRDPGSLFSVSTDVRIFVGSNIDMYAVAGKGMLDKPYLAADSLEEASTIANKATRCEVIDWNKAVRGDDAGKIDALDPVVIRDVRRIHPGKYIVGVSAKTPFWLVCNETYNPGWEARATDGPGTAWRDRIIERSTLLCRVFQAGRNPVMETHARLNDYANGWFIGRTGDFSIVVEYGPQGIYELAKLVSWCCGLLCLLFMSRAFFVR